MSETPAPQIVTQAVDRYTWSDDVAVNNMMLLPSSHDDKLGIILPPESLQPSWHEFSPRALLRVIKDARQDDGAFHDNVLESLGQSSHWNDILSGKLKPEDFDKLEEDPVVQKFIADMPDDLKLKMISDRHKMLEVETEALRLQFPEIMKLFTDGIDRGVQEGYLPSSLEGLRTFETLTSTGINITDSLIFDLTNETNTAGLYSSREDRISIRNGEHKDFRELVVVHELLHRLQGGTFMMTTFESGYRMFERSRVGFDQTGRLVGLNEALTEHTAEAITDGNFATIDPRERAPAPPIYRAERILTAELINRSGGIVSLKTLLHANFEDTNSDGNTLARRRMVKEINTAYERGTLTKFSQLCTAAKGVNDKIDSASMDEKIVTFTDRIHPPEIDTNGHVTKKGWIDTEFAQEPAVA